MNTKIELTKEELTVLKKAKKELLTDKNATFTSNSRNDQKFIDVAKKYGVGTQKIWDMVL